MSHQKSSPVHRLNDQIKTFVGGIPDTASEEDLRHFMQQFGSVRKVTFSKDKSGHKKGYGFVIFNHIKLPDQLFRQHRFFGKTMEVKKSHHLTIEIYNIAPDLSGEDIKEALNTHGVRVNLNSIEISLERRQAQVCLSNTQAYGYLISRQELTIRGVSHVVGAARRSSPNYRIEEEQERFPKEYSPKDYLPKEYPLSKEELASREDSLQESGLTEPEQLSDKKHREEGKYKFNGKAEPFIYSQPTGLESQGGLGSTPSLVSLDGQVALGEPQTGLNSQDFQRKLTSQSYSYHQQQFPFLPDTRTKAVSIQFFTFPGRD